jgi:hypothetical protein
MHVISRRYLHTMYVREALLPSVMKNEVTKYLFNVNLPELGFCKSYV